MTFNELIQLEGLVVEKAKTEPVFRQGDNNQSLYFLQSGLLKAYYTCVDGKEFIKSFS